MRPHEKLDVWCKAMDFVVTVYKDYGVLPEGREVRLNFTDQAGGDLRPGEHRRRRSTPLAERVRTLHLERARLGE